MNWYLNFVRGYPFISAMIQFAVLGTLGDLVSRRLSGSKESASVSLILTKMLVWAVLSIFIKVAFIGFEGFVNTLVLYRVLPVVFFENGFLNALARSLAMNLQFGVFLVLLHRLLDNVVERKRNWKKLDSAFLSLLWFWIPAHTVTFMLPKDYQIGLAALWSFMLGLLLSTFARSTREVE